MTAREDFHEAVNNFDMWVMAWVCHLLELRKAAKKRRMERYLDDCADVILMWKKWKEKNAGKGLPQSND